MYSFHSHSVLWLIIRNIFTNIKEQAIVGCLKYIYNLFNEIKELVKVSKQIWIFHIWNGFLVEHLYKCEKNEYMEWSSPILYPHGTFIWICLFVLSKSCSGTGSGGSSISTSSVGPDPSCPESQESSDQILLLEMRMMMRQKSLPSS